MTTINLSKENKFWVYGALIALFISLFTFFVVRNFAQKSDARHKAELRLLNLELQKRADIAQLQADSIQVQNNLNYQLSSRLETAFLNQNILLQSISKDYQKSLIELNKTKNEKIYIPLDVPVSEQSAFISKFKYEP